MPIVEAKHASPNHREQGLIDRATSLLREERVEGRRLKSHELRTITSANKVLIAAARGLVIQNQASLAAFEAELRFSFERLKEGRTIA
jgi:hypothetical protein